MNLSPTFPYGRAILAAQRRQHDKLQSDFYSLTFGGIWLFVIGLTVIGSGFRALRPNVFGLLVQPYLFPVLLATPYVVLARIQELPTRVLMGLGLFCSAFVMASLGPSSSSVLIKFVVSMLTVATVALLVRSRTDLILGAMGLSIAIGVLAVRGLDEADTALGVEAIEMANKNSYSLYALPALLLGGFVILRMKPKVRLVQVVFIASGLAALAAIFMSGNRSGYLGAVVVAILLIRERKIAGLALIALVIAAISYYLIHYGSTEIFERRLGQTVEGTESDNLRLQLFRTCVRIGLAYPVAGVSPGELGLEIGRRVASEHPGGQLGPHNVFGLIIGGTGLLCAAALAILGWSLWTWPYTLSRREDPPPQFIEARKLLRYMLILWTIRGLFNDEILYNPGFCVGLGLAIGGCVVAGKLRPPPASNAAHRPQPALA
jgi:hypothetical protein